ncbi:Gaa1-domain-containing protein [Trametes coccinea BRFM310]|uniref:Gaa1-domain-containing protein n=1 Tax=Trametes coccinea (strain BRFM310) TaxID=1353009 RepID=A0A1Y2IK63_TRAC3|nr:Gaa1-domain-containing protein [Trametes coccinea BRFM310]
MNGARNVLAKLKQKLRGQGDPSAAKIRRQRALREKIWKGLPFIKLLLFTVGYIWLLVLPSSQLGQGTYIDENALQPGQVNTYWNWGEVHHADRILEDLEQLRDRNATHDEIARYVVTEFEKYGIPARTQSYSFDTIGGEISGTNAYGVLQAPRASGTEAIVISASWLSRTGEGDGTLNLRGVSTVLALAKYLKKYSLWAKDLVFVISDGYLDGMQAWISTYHGETQPNMRAEPLTLQSGVIWTALNIDYPGHSFSHLGIFFEGLNGRLPNQDLMNSVSLISRYTVHVPTLVYDHIDPREDRSQPDLLPAWLPEPFKHNRDVQEYASRAKNIYRHMNYQARGAASGVHGLFHQFRIDAITLFAVPATGPHGFHALGRILESSLRTCNNLLERLHASFFFYLLVAPGTFMKIGSYLPSAILVGTAMLFTGLGEWVKAGWTISPAGVPSSEGVQSEKAKPKDDKRKWQRRHRPVLEPVAIMVLTHILGVVLFLLISTSWFAANQKIAGPITYILFTAIPFMASAFVPRAPSSHASIPSVLKAFNLCFTSAIISITSVLNFSLAATLAVFLGLPLTLASPPPSSSPLSARVAKYAAYSILALGWLVLCPEETRKAIWNWEVLRVWFAPFVCVVYVPLVMQAGLVCLLPS